MVYNLIKKINAKALFSILTRPCSYIPYHFIFFANTCRQMKYSSKIMTVPKGAFGSTIRRYGSTIRPFWQYHIGPPDYRFIRRTLRWLTNGFPVLQSLLFFAPLSMQEYLLQVLQKLLSFHLQHLLGSSSSSCLFRLSSHSFLYRGNSSSKIPFSIF